MDKVKVTIKSKFMGDTGYIFLGNIFSKIFGFGTFYFLAKYLSVENYGTLTVLLALITTITDLINSGLNASIIRYVARFNAQNESNKINNLISTIFYNYFIIGGLICIGTFIFSEKISKAILKGNYSNLVLWTSLGIFFTFISGIFTSYFQGKEEYKKYFLQSSVTPFIRILYIIFLVTSKKLTIQNATIMFNITPLFALFTGLYLTRKDLNIKFKSYSLEIIKEINDFGKWMYLWSIVIIIQSRMNVYLLAIFTTKQQVSYFDIANKFLGLITIIISVYTVTLNPKFSKLICKREILLEMKKVKKMMLLFTFYLLLCGLTVPFLIKLIFGLKYIKVIYPLVLLVMFNIPFIWNAPYNAVLFSLGKSKVYLVSGVIELIITLGSAFVLLPRYGAIGAVLSQGLAIISSMIVSRIGFRYYISKLGD